jgi:hypothetical protein
MSVSKVSSIVASIVVCLLVAAVFFGGRIQQYLFNDTEPLPLLAGATTTPQQATTTRTTPKNTLPPEPEFVLPENAKAIDDYAFTLDSRVYFKSITNKKPLEIMDAVADAFDDLTPFILYPHAESMCGTNPVYKFYGDGRRTYFYQIWRAPLFRTTQIEVIVKADPNTFQSTGATTATDGKVRYTIGHQKVATSTCALVISKS